MKKTSTLTAAELQRLIDSPTSEKGASKTSYNPKLPTSKASPFVNDAVKTVQQPNAAKPVTSEKKMAMAPSQPKPTEVKRTKVKPVAVTIATAAGMLEASQPTIRRWIKSGKLQTFRIGRVVRIPVSQFAQLMGAHG